MCPVSWKLVGWAFQLGTRPWGWWELYQPPPLLPVVESYSCFELKTSSLVPLLVQVSFPPLARAFTPHAGQYNKFPFSKFGCLGGETQTKRKKAIHNCRWPNPKEFNLLRPVSLLRATTATPLATSKKTIVALPLLSVECWRERKWRKNNYHHHHISSCARSIGSWNRFKAAFQCVTTWRRTKKHPWDMGQTNTWGHLPVRFVGFPFSLDLMVS